MPMRVAARSVRPNSPTSHTWFMPRCMKSRNSIAGWRDPQQIATNATMLVNALAVLGTQPSLRHVTLLQGTKAYGAHIAPMRIPGRERQPRHPGANFYWNQQDHTIEMSARHGWTYSIMRPQVVCGFAFGSPMNMVSALGVFAAVLRERGEPLRFPGGAPCITQATDADLLARAILWAAETPGCANETFNIANGDVMVWQEIFGVVADVFGMPLAEPAALRLAHEMPDRAKTWQNVVDRHGLASHTMETLVGASWQFADAVFGYGGSPPDTVVSTVKARQFGFGECIDTRGHVRAPVDAAAGATDFAAMSARNSRRGHRRNTCAFGIGGFDARVARSARLFECGFR